MHICMYVHSQYRKVAQHTLLPHNHNIIIVMIVVILKMSLNIIAHTQAPSSHIHPQSFMNYYYFPFSLPGLPCVSYRSSKQNFH